MGGMCRIGARQSNAIASPAARYVRIAPESTVINYLSMSGGDPEQAARLRRLMLASAAYAICIPLVWLACEFNLVARGPAWILVAMMVVVNVGLYAVFR